MGRSAGKIKCAAKAGAGRFMKPFRVVCRLYPPPAFRGFLFLRCPIRRLYLRLGSKVVIGILGPSCERQSYDQGLAEKIFADLYSGNGQGIDGLETPCVVDA